MRSVQDEIRELEREARRINEALISSKPIPHAECDRMRKRYLDICLELGLLQRKLDEAARRN